MEQATVPPRRAFPFRLARPCGLPMPPGLARPSLRWLAPAAIGLAALAVGVAVVRLVPYLADLATYGYLGIFALMVVSGGSVLLPVPGMAGVLAAGMLWNPLLVGLVAGLGNATGEFTGYVAGRSGRALLNPGERSGWGRVECWLRRRGFLALVLFAAIPNPAFDVVGIVAGGLGFSPGRFWLACAIGNTVKYTAVALLGGLAARLV